MDFFLVSGTLRVRYKPALVDTGAISRALGRAGFTARVKRLELAVPSWQGKKQIILLGLCGLLAGLGFTISQLDSVIGPLLTQLGSVLGIGLLQKGFSHVLADFLYSAAIIVGGFSTARKALAAARNLTPDMNLLMTVAVIGAAAIEQWTEAAALS